MARRTEKLRALVLPALAAVLLRSIIATLRIRHADSDSIDRLNRNGENYILAFWHSDNLFAIFSRVRLPAVPVISTHRDGEMMVNLMRHFGVRQFARGSSTRGGSSALRELLRAARDGKRLAISPDGPKGPLHVVKDGVIAASRIAGIPIVPVRFHPEKAWIFARSWDQSRLPRPFARGVFLYGEPISVPREATSEDQERYRLRLENELNGLRERAAKEFDELWKRGKRGRIEGSVQ